MNGRDRLSGRPWMSTLGLAVVLLAIGATDASCGGSSENTAALCGDGADNDGDGFTDCADQDCLALVRCAPGSGDAGGDVRGDAVATRDVRRSEVGSSTDVGHEADASRAEDAPPPPRDAVVDTGSDSDGRPDVCQGRCDERECGDDGCGGSCGSCPLAAPYCVAGLCATCQPVCGDRVCGDDGCGGSCGACADPTPYCVEGRCADCAPDCAGRECGDDGCGGSCGGCATCHACRGDGTCAGPCGDVQPIGCGDEIAFEAIAGCESYWSDWSCGMSAGGRGVERVFVFEPPAPTFATVTHRREISGGWALLMVLEGECAPASCVQLGSGDYDGAEVGFAADATRYYLVLDDFMMPDPYGGTLSITCR